MFYKKNTKLLLYLIIFLLFIIVIYISYHNAATITEGIDTSICPTDNPIIDSSNLELYFYCKDVPISTVSAEIISATGMIRQLQANNKTYLTNTFTRDIETATNLISSKSPLIGKNWNDPSANVLLTSTQTTLANDLNYLNYLTKGSPYSPPQYTAIPPSIAQYGSLSAASCPALINPNDPSGNPLAQLNKMLMQQQSRLATIKANIASIESRYPIQFQLGTVSVDKAPNASPKISISGDLPNPVLNFTLITPINGKQGDPKQGPTGPQGPQGGSGSKGLDGYWGTDGLPDTLFSPTT
jgi:hypothetical protein